MFRPLIHFVIAAFLAGCATTPSDPYADRRRAYERLLTFIESGMTRRQLYALLPPASTPQSSGPFVYSLPPSLMETVRTETYPLDKDFSLRINIALADRTASRPKFPRKSKPLPSGEAGSRISPATVDELLFALPEKVPPQPSKENPDDVILCTQVISRHEKSGQ